jgi:hypothetical protein
VEANEQNMAQILVKNRADFSVMARRGYKKHGRGAIFIWESEEKPAEKAAFSTYRANYAPVADPAFARSGPHPKEMAGHYDPETEFVAVFVGAEDEIHAVRVALAAEPAQQ